MRILVAPDKFKGSLSAGEAAQAIARGLSQQFPEAEIIQSPIADGGEGTMELISNSLGAEPRDVQVTGPAGLPVLATYGLAGTRAVMEMSAASGLVLIVPGTIDPWDATTFGTGEMILDAVNSGAREILIGIGGSATNDGGMGMAEALGFEFLFESGTGRLMEIRSPAESPLDGATMTVACDVQNPLLGEDGCTRIYGPQKGVSTSEFERHEARLERLAEIVARDVRRVSPMTAGAGAAGGLGFGLIAFCGAELRSGFELVAESTGLAEAIESADLVVTGEGSMDAQTLMGKGPAGVAKLARAAGKRVTAICGIARDEDALLEQFDAVVSLEGRARSLADSIERAADLLSDAASSVRI